MIIAVDFDGTIVEHRYPEIGKEIPFAMATLKKLQEDGHKLILWSVREGKRLEEAKEWCKQRGVVFHAYNSFLDEDVCEDYLEEKATNAKFSRKLKVDCFIDDRNVGGLLDWGTAYYLISHRMTLEEYIEEQITGNVTRKKKKKKFLGLF